MRNLTAYRKRDRAFVDLLGWAVLADDGRVWMRSGDIVGGFWSSPPDASSASRAVRQSLSLRTNEALKRLGTGWALWADVDVVPAAGYPDASASHFPPDAVAAAAVDEERRRQFHAEGAHYERDHAVVFSFTPPSAAAGRVADALHGKGGKNGPTPFATALQMFDEEMNRFEDQVGRSYRLRPMQSYGAAGDEGLLHDELVSYLGYCAHGTHFPIALPPDGAFLDTVIGAKDFWSGDMPLLGDEHIAVVAVDGFPSVSLPGILDRLNSLQLPGGYRFTQRFIFLDPEHAVTELKKYRKQWVTQVVPFFKKTLGFGEKNPDAFAAEQVASVDEAVSLARSGKARFGFYNAKVVLRGRDRATLRAAAREVERSINDCGYRCRLEDVNATEAYLASLPGHVEEDVRRPPVNTLNLGDTIPSSGVWTGSAAAPSPLFPPGLPPLMQGATEGGIVFRLNIHKGDNGNFASFGPPGAGKSSLLAAIKSQFLRYPRAKVRSVDVKGSMMVACLAAGGHYVEVGDGPAFAPFAHLETGADMLRAAAFVSTCYQLQRNGKLLESRQRTAVREALRALRGQPEFRSVSDFCIQVQDREVREAMRNYCGGLFDATTEEASETHWDAFDITAILHGGDEVLLPATVCLINRFERGVDSHPQLWGFDEVAIQIQAPFWRPRFRSLLKLNRSRNVAVGLATQNLADMAGNDLHAIFIENVPTYICGANAEAQQGGTGDEKGPADFYQAHGFSWEQRETIRLMEPKRHYFVRQGEDNRVVDFNFGPIARALWGSTSEADVIAARSVVAETGPGLAFARAWLKHKGVDDALLR